MSMRALVSFSMTCLIGVFGAAGSASAQISGVGWARCLFAGTATITPGLTMHVQDVEFRSTFALTQCQSSDATITSGTGQTAGTLRGNCLEGEGTATQWITWSNGRNSVAPGFFLNLGAELVSESIASGEFAGADGWNVNVITGPLTAAGSCAVGGLTGISFAGYISFG
jgi:hypothetical protein